MTDSKISFKEFSFEAIMETDIEQMSEDALRALRTELNERRVSAPTRRAQVKRQQTVVKAQRAGTMMSLNDLADV